MSAQALRLPPRPTEVIDRSRELAFRWNGTSYPAFEGDTIVSALTAAGVRTLTRSFKYHRPRGVLTADLHDPNCFMTVDGRPNVAGAHTRVHAGMQVTSQNAWPSVAFDVRAANQAMGRFLSAGFYYKTFMSPAFLRGFYQRVLQQFSPGGPLPRDPSDGYYDKRFLFHDIVVAGAGPAGIAAALGAAESGARVLLVDEEHAIGGHLRWWDPAGQELLRELRTRVAGSPSIEVLLDATVFGRYDGNWVGVHQRTTGGHARERLYKGRPRVLIVATGLLERPYVFGGNDLPGVMLSTAVQRLLALHAVCPGSEALLLTANPAGDATAKRLADAGAAVRIVDARRGGGIRRAIGRGTLHAVELSDGRRVDADLLVTATGWTAQMSLLSMAGVTPTFDTEASRFVAPPPDRRDVVAVGGLVGDGSAEQLVDHAFAVGRAAARGTPWPTAPLRPGPHRALFSAGTDGFVDFSEDVEAHDIAAAVHEGYTSIELAKRFTTATMGPTQGSYSMVNTVALHAAATGNSVAETGTPTWRPPYTPVTLGALAGRRFAPVRRTAMHSWHEAAGATLMTTGQWLRPQRYGDPVAEAREVRRSVGIIDVSTLGKFELVGADVPRLLELVYVNRWSNLAVGSVRYGLMCGEDGVVFDDGVTGRLADTRYVMSATSSGAARVDQWLRGWLSAQGSEWDVAVTDVTECYASMNVAGPRSREVLLPLVDGVSLGPDGLGYMKVAGATVAGIEGCFIWRIGFTGELAYEIYMPAGFGLHVWEAVLQAGERHGIRPFGVEAQRILRIEKGHPVVGQDTDATIGPHALGLGGMVRTDKADTVGLPALRWLAENPESVPTVLVGLHPEGDWVPPEATQIVHAGLPVGRVTSSCWSPELGRPICLALLRRDLAVDGSSVALAANGAGLVRASVRSNTAHVDPEGVRLRA